jgi:hypothetical protein
MSTLQSIISAGLVHAYLPNAQRRTLEGQTHAVDPQALAPLLVEVFAG